MDKVQWLGNPLLVILPACPLESQTSADFSLAGNQKPLPLRDQNLLALVLWHWPLLLLGLPAPSSEPKVHLCHERLPSETDHFSGLGNVHDWPACHYPHLQCEQGLQFQNEADWKNSAPNFYLCPIHQNRDKGGLVHLV